MGGGRRSPITASSSSSSSSSSSLEPLPPELAEYAAVSSESEPDECCVYDDLELEALLGARSLPDRSLLEAKDLIRRRRGQAEDLGLAHGMADCVILIEMDLIQRLLHWWMVCRSEMFLIRAWRYKPGDWIEGVGDTKAEGYLLPEITTLLLVGPRGAGKSTLVNRITRVFDKDDDSFAPDRAQVSHNFTSNGTGFLQEYIVPRNSSAICVYDTWGLSSITEKNFTILQRWMTKGISHGEMVMDTDDAIKMMNLKLMGRHRSFLPCKTRTVNFVIFVVDGASVLKSIDSNNKRYIDLLHETFMYPFLSFRDDKPVVVVTHGDRLSLQQRAHVRSLLAELLSIPLQQIFDIPGSDDYETDLAILDMLRYCIQRAERHFPVKLNYLMEMHGRATFAKIADRLMDLDAVIEAAIIFLCIVILLLRISDKLLPS